MRPGQALIAANGVAMPQVYVGFPALLRKNIRKSSAKHNDFVSQNRKLASNSFHVMGELFLETLMAAKAVLQPDPLPALTNDVNQLDERLNAKEQAICPFPA